MKSSSASRVTQVVVGRSRKTSSTAASASSGSWLQQGPLLGVREKQIQGEAELVTRGVNPAEEQVHDRFAQLELTQLPRFLGADEPGDRAAVVRLPTAAQDHLVHERREAGERRLDSREILLERDPKRQAHRRRPAGQRLPIILAGTEELADHPSRVGLTEFGDELASAPLDEGIDELVCESLELRHHLRDDSR